MVEVAYVPLWVSELIRTALDDHGISAHMFEEHLLPGYGFPMVRIVVRADQRDAGYEQPLVAPQLGQAWQLPARCMMSPQT